MRPDERAEFVSGLLQEMFRSPLLGDATVIWLDLLVDEGNEAARDLVVQLAESYAIQAEILFRLASPAELPFLFEAAIAKGDDFFFHYVKAARAVRRSEVTLAAVRRHLRSKVPIARRLAAAIIDIHRDETSLPQMVALLGDADDEVKGAAFSALSSRGNDALPDVLALVQDERQSPEVRARGLAALRGIGYLDEHISSAIDACLSTDVASDPKVLQAALLAAVHRRDTSKVQYAGTALTAPNKTYSR
jgi:hypothetical protein